MAPEGHYDENAVVDVGRKTRRGWRAWSATTKMRPSNSRRGRDECRLRDRAGMGLNHLIARLSFYPSYPSFPTSVEEGTPPPRRGWELYVQENWTSQSLDHKPCNSIKSFYQVILLSSIQLLTGIIHITCRSMQNVE